MKRKALGKGLSALLPEPPDRSLGAVREIGIDNIEPNPHQPRSTIGPARLEELTSSIRQSGIVQPILVRPHRSPFQIVAGERRWRAARAA